MIITKIQGGLGNQLFQYAAGRRLAKKHNTILKFDISVFDNQNNRQYKLDKFHIAENIASEKEIKLLKNIWNKLFDKFKLIGNKKIINYVSYGYDQRILKLGANVYLDGYWQNEKYFSDISSLVKNEFELKNKLSQNADKLLKIIANNNNSASIHIRRGDYVANKKFAKIYNHLDDTYYQSAIKKIKESIKNPFFVIFSDDIQWVKDNINLPENYVFAGDYKLEDFEELYLMSKCQHNIISNSTFSWWAAWLNKNDNKIIIGPKIWFKLSNDDQGIMPKKWIKL